MVQLFRAHRSHWRRIGFLAGLIVLASGYWVLGNYGAIATGFFAKNLCSGVFVAGRSAPQVVENDILVYSPKALFAAIRWSIDGQSQTVTTHLPLGLGRSMAKFRSVGGCALVASAESAEHASSPSRTATENFGPAVLPSDADQLWPQGQQVDSRHLTDAVREKLARALANGFAEAGESALRRTRAIVVVHKGRIVAERYAEGFGPHTRLAGWSMAKSVTSAWIGVLARDQVLSIDEPIGLAAWREVADVRQRLSFRQLLNMVSGLEFTEAYTSPFSDVNRMLFFSQSAAAYAAAKPATAEPGTVFNYSSGSTNLLSQALRERLASAYESAPDRLLFKPIGMSTALFETDAGGTYVGSSYLYASARDWARFGLLYGQDGVWNQQRLLPDGWVAFSIKPSPANRDYGAHWWLHEPAEKLERTVPADLYQATGHAGQRISIIPSHELVVVRLGMTLNGPALRHAELLRDIIDAIN